MRLLTRLLAIALALSAVAVTVSARNSQTATSSIALSPDDLTVTLARCRVEVTTSTDDTSVLRVVRTDGSEVSIESIGVSIRNNTVRIDDGESQNSLDDLIFSFTLRTAQNLQIDGTDLDLTVTSPVVSAKVVGDDGEPDRTPGGVGVCATPHLLNLVGGTARVIGGGCTKIVSTQAELSIEQTSQTLEIQATGGRFRIHDHQGRIILNGREHFGGIIVDHRGDLELVMEQGSMTVEGGAGSIHCQAEHYGLHVTGRHGSLEATGTVAVFRIDHSEMETIRINGIRTLGQFSDGRGNIRATLEGGSLTVTDWTGRIDLQSSQGTTLEIDSVDGDFAFTATDTAGEVAGVTGHTRGNLTDSEVAFSQLKSIEITADASQTSVEEVPRITQMNIIGGHLRYESSRVAGKPKIHLSAEATADIVIPQPCVVRCTGPGTDNGNVSVSGCEIRAPNQPWGGNRRQAEPANHLEIEMQEFSEVFVSGY
jgi:hypothetical protein